jgi:hypothetical protein
MLVDGSSKARQLRGRGCVVGLGWGLGYLRPASGGCCSGSRWLSCRNGWERRLHALVDMVTFPLTPLIVLLPLLPPCYML